MNRIKVVFCFDENLTDQVQAAAASLLDYGVTESVHYHIYCVCTKDAAQAEEKFRQVVSARDEMSLLTVRTVDNPYQDAYEVRGVSAGTYLRLMLHRILPEEDKVIYTDVDVLFRESLESLWEIPLDDYVLAAAKGAVNFQDKWEWNSVRPYWHYLEGMKGRYINAGVTVLNLAQIRRRNLEAQWNKWAKEKLYYQDQDILNITCQGAVYYLPSKYNRLAYMEEQDYDRLVSEGICTAADCREALEHPAIIHYAGDKPWKRYDTNLGYLWWKYVKGQPDLAGLFDEKQARRNHGPTVAQRGIRKIRRLLGVDEE